MFLTDAHIRASVVAALKVSAGDLPDYWDQLINESHTAAYQEIVGALIGRGFTQAQIDAWSRGAEFEKDLALFWALTKGGGLHNYDDRFPKSLDRRKDLLTVQVYSGGVWVTPGEDPGTVGSGAISTSDDLFNYRDPDDPNIGEVTRF